MRNKFCIIWVRKKSLMVIYFHMHIILLLFSFYTTTNNFGDKSYNVTHRNTDKIFFLKTHEKKCPNLLVPQFIFRFSVALPAGAEGMTNPIISAASRWQLAHHNAYNCLQSPGCLFEFLKASASCRYKLKIELSENRVSAHG